MSKRLMVTSEFAQLSHDQNKLANINLFVDGFQIMLDNRPVRTPSKQILFVPRSKPNLATAIAVEWDLLVNAQQALKQHFIPLTSLTSRALDIAEEDRKGE